MTHTTAASSAEVSVNSRDFHPFETRDQNLFNLIHGQALPSNARLHEKSQTSWSSSLIITNALNIDSNSEESIYLDYEAYRLNLSYQYGLNTDWNLKVDIPLIYQSGGIFDSAIDSWHQFFGMPRGFRPTVEHDQYDIQYAYRSQTMVQLNEESTSLGDIQVAMAHSILDDETTDMSAWASLKLPTGKKEKLTGNGATDIAAWLALNQQLSGRWLVNMNAGAVILGADEYNNIPLSDYALYGHAMLGWLVTDSINLKLQLQAHTSYYEQSRLSILGDSYFLTFGGTINIDQCNQIDLAFSEDIKVDASPDASMIISWRGFTSGC
ncbi:MAG: DUF3187 family protein [Gammaproteobacteria bacterium]|nr:DUF3187 family protein [Gammaproteobacteria bacterium]NNJ51138.1 DUF3187 family protein [Gammaproteobacteria bacterium]